MRRKIVFYYIILVLIGVVVAGFFTSQLTERFYRYEVEEKLKSDSALIKYQLSEKAASGQDIDYNTAAKEYSKVLKASAAGGNGLDLVTRVTFIGVDGTVLGESERDYHSMENHLERKEVQEALHGRIGTDSRLSKSLGLEYLYVAVPVETPNVILRVSVPLVQLNRIDESILYYTLFGTIAGILLTLLLALRFSASITNPIKELISVSRNIADGDYSKRAGIKTSDELGKLSDAFNLMAERLEKTVDELQDKNLKMDLVMNSLTSGIIAVDANYRIILINSIACTLFGIEKESDVIGSNLMEVVRSNRLNNQLQETMLRNKPEVTELVIGTADETILRLYTNPIRANDNPDSCLGGIVSIHDITNIRKLEQIRTDFVSNVTHELKTPLTSIRGFIETLRNGAINDTSVAEKFLEIIDIEAERLYMLINDILQLSEIETRQQDINIGVHSLDSILEEISSILEGVAEKKAVTLNWEIEAGISVTVNRDRVKQMLINLIDNGIKYNVEGGRVDIEITREGGGIRFEVRDTGIGIDKANLPRIFERFYRVDKGRSRSMGGTGLGLSIVKHIVNLYSGDIKVFSEPGKGTQFIIHLPVLS